GVVERLTPTCVGRTTCGTISPRENVAHPHVRGEDGGHDRDTGCERGSPPRAWGGPDAVNPPAVSWRLTPTCVGRTTERRLDCARAAGSPPRAWGGQASR